jgi:hypothetical protein
MRRWIGVLVAILVPGLVGAQDAPRGWPGLATSALPAVYVLDDTGTETSGRLLRLNPDSLDLLVDGAERRFEAVRVRRIQKRGDPLRNGALIGAAVGLGLGVVAGGMSDCPGDDPGGNCPEVRAALVLFSTGVYAAIGTALDALLVGRTTLYQAATVGRTVAVEAAAQPGHRGRTGIELVVRW